jgi:xylulokinase
MRTDILAIDVGTTAFKIGVFSANLEKRCETSRRYDVHFYDQGKADIEPEKWWWALRDTCREIREFLSEVGVISLSVTTPGMVAMAEDGSALSRAILFCDGRSHEQAKEIRALVGDEFLLEQTCNLPASGGSSLCSMMWLREHEPEVWRATAKVGHCNTYMVKRLTGQWAIDPSTMSITGLYNTRRHDLTWNQTVLRAADLSEDLLPPLMESYEKAGDILPEVARELGLRDDCEVLCSGNDAVLAALSGGLTAPGDINDINGTCEITNVCVDHPVSSPNFNVRCHVIPNRWVTFFVLNAGGKALEWFHGAFCQDMTEREFFEDYVPTMLKRFLTSADIDRWDAELPEYVPYLQGSRYCTEPLTASFSGLRVETTRDDLLLGLIKGIARYHGEHIEEVSRLVKLGNRVMTSGGVSKIRHYLEAKRRWTGDFEYLFQDQSSLLGAAMLGQFFLTDRYGEVAESESARRVA